ncbi:ABC transporter ATP-binding protein [Fontisphaera persica]|uniref:ABC transporter ATP-binding protein n=1 Tax=Fontisphaera persica TaxID=2974023 RepID=UPI0024C03003|nr:ABC transporter ATP-binding protein [Fontisphaera persica]WCJ58243.1 ABC transporter ATP-binding protein [Fontisphaera persica]
MSELAPPPARQPLLAAREVRRTFHVDGQAVPVLRGVTLEVQPGEFVAVRGASGAGKSTLLHLLAGLDQPTAGEIFFRGLPVHRLSALELAAMRNRHIGLVFQAYHLLPELDALENVCLPARLARLPADEAEARARELLARVGLSERWRHRPRQLSGGEQQRVALARALINRPDVILADEPTGNLDSQTGGQIIDLLVSLQREHRTALVIATHDASIAARAGRVVELRDGQVFGEPAAGV